ncbi:hypothetical protein ACGFIF_43170 [Kribbella sp. NPDC049174]|uniref:hypothetical protein n=1 Tax=Kribbella sp. NPDC049174 TaxID=3364112 RepID=UPI003714DE45
MTTAGLGRAHALARRIIRRSVKVLPEHERGEVLKELLNELWHVANGNPRGWRSVYAPLSFARGQRENCQMRRDIAAAARMHHGDRFAVVLVSLFGPALITMLCVGAAVMLPQVYSGTVESPVAPLLQWSVICLSLGFLSRLPSFMRSAARSAAIGCRPATVMAIRIVSLVTQWGVALIGFGNLGLLVWALAGDADAYDTVFRDGAMFPDRFDLNLAATVGGILASFVGSRSAWSVRRHILLVGEVAKLSEVAD